MERSKGHKPNLSHLDNFFITKDQEVVFVFICDPSFNMDKPTASNHYKTETGSRATKTGWEEKGN